MICSSNIANIFLLCAVFILLFKTISTFDSDISIIEGIQNLSPTTAPKVAKMVFPLANKIDAMEIQTRSDHLTKITNELVDIQKRVFSVEKVLGITYTYKDPVKNANVQQSSASLIIPEEILSSDIYDMTITGESLNQTINLEVPVGRQGNQGAMGDQGEVGNRGEEGEKGIEGPNGMSTILK